MSAGTLTISENHCGPIRRTSLAWVSDGSGNVNGIATKLVGAIVRVEFIPSATASPSANYDVQLKSESGIDLLAGQGANLSNSAASQFAPACPFTDGTTTSIAPPQVNEDVELDVRNAGSAKAGTVVVYTR